MPIGDPMGYVDEEMPLAYRLLEDLPGISASAGFAVMRGSNTMMYGGFMDDGSSLLRSRRAKRYAIMNGGKISTPGAGGFYGGVRGGGALGRRANRASAASKTPFLRSARLNNITLNPMALTRYHSASIFSGASGVYSPFAASSFLGNTKFGKGLVEKSGITLNQGEQAFSPGLLSAVTAGVKTDRLERRALKGSSRAAAKLSRISTSTLNMASANPNLMARSAVQAAKQSPRFAGQYMIPASQRLQMARQAGFSGSVYDNFMKSAVGQGGAGTVGVRGNIMASSLPGAMTGYYAGYARGALGFAGVSGLTGRALQGAETAQNQFIKAFTKAGLGDDALARTALESGNLIKTLKATDGGVLKGLSGIASQGGGKVLAARGAALAIPGLNVLATASLVYDLGKMAGEVVKSGINLARDANRSLQGSIAKPAFGMGYKDTEAAATSRARGVMAIQNSRLNARSMLGTEGAMMAAHYG